MSNLYGTDVYAVYSYLTNGAVRRKRFKTREAAARYQKAEDGKREVKRTSQQKEIR